MHRPDTISASAAQIVSNRTMQINGDSLFYREAGATAKPSIVLLHGFPLSSPMFRDLIPAVSLYGWAADPLFARACAETLQRLLPCAEVLHYATGHFALEEDGADIVHRMLARLSHRPPQSPCGND